VRLQFQFNPGVLPFFPSQFLPKHAECDMIQPLGSRYDAVDESLADWNPLEYNPLLTHDAQNSPFSQEADGSAAQTCWGRMSAVDSEYGGQHERQTSGTTALPEQVTLCSLHYWCLVPGVQ